MFGTSAIVTSGAAIVFPARRSSTAPKPAKLIPKGLFAVSFWLEVLLKKFEFKQPLQRTVSELSTLGSKVSPGTLDVRLEKDSADAPAVGGAVRLARRGRIAAWHMDETRWPMWLLVCGEVEEGEGNSPKKKKKWWAWVEVGPDATAFFLEPTRSGEVPKSIFPQRDRGDPQRRPL